MTYKDWSSGGAAHSPGVNMAYANPDGAIACLEPKEAIV